MANRLQRGLEWHRAGDINRAAAEYSAILRISPRHPEALRYLGVCKLQQNDLGRAIELLRTALKVAPDDAPTHANLGSALASAGDSEAALACFDRAIALEPRVAGFHSLRGDQLFALQQAADAIAAYDQAIELSPDFFDAHNNRGNALREAGQAEAALLAFERASTLAPGHPAPHNNRATVLLQIRRPDDALKSCRRALELQSSYADAWYNAGSALMDLGRLDEATVHFSKALEIEPRFFKALFNLGIAFQLRSRHEEAAAAFERLLKLKPDYPHAPGYLMAARTHSCDWRGIHELREKLVNGAAAGQPVCDPFTLLTVCDDPELQLRCARQFSLDANAEAAPAPLPCGIALGDKSGVPAGARTARPLRIAYLSADFHDHATARLFADVLERHDRSRLELTGVSFGPDDGSPMRARLTQAFDTFMDVRGTSDAAVCEMLRAAEIDIAVDMKGFTADSRIGIFARRAAPLQVSFLGYPGTSGAPFIDYLVADPIVVPDAKRSAFSESIVYLPNCYQPTDSTRPLPSPPATDRAAAGLPDDAFVFCSFNSSYKILPKVFDVWMRMLTAVPGSVLWLLRDNDAVVRNLRSEARARGVAPDRIVFAPRVDADAHLSRHRLADLFLDTLPVNAHTTASDALWAGLPVLTCAGASFAGRVAASALHAIGLSELVTSDMCEYEALGVQLATQPPRLQEIATRLERNRDTHPLFNADLFRRHLEFAYEMMWDSRDQPPRDIRIADQSSTSNADGARPAIDAATIRS